VERTKMRNTARAIIITKTNKFLFMCREGGQYYVTIGGGIEDGETSEQTICRELLEESGTVPKSLQLLFKDTNDDGEHFLYLVHEKERLVPMENLDKSRYEIIEVSKEQIHNTNILPEKIKHYIIENL
jgi:8-oxo-dGTP pyrophosphatase MutT (NUDIX family)